MMAECIERSVHGFFLVSENAMMTRMVPMLLATGLVAVGFGCQTEARTDVSVAPDGATQAVAADAIIVTLRVPNMV